MSKHVCFKILHLSGEKFKQLLEEQVKKQRSEEFDDIGHVLDQIDDETKKDSCWRFLELVYKAECNKGKKKRKIKEKDLQLKQKKIKTTGYGNSDSMESLVISTKDCGNRHIQTNNGSLEKNKIESENELNPWSKSETCTYVERTSDPGKCDAERDEASDVRSTGKKKLCCDEDGKAGGSSDISGDCISNENETNSRNDDYDDDDNDNDDNVDDNSEDDEDDDSGDDSQEESKLSLSYGKQHKLC